MSWACSDPRNQYWVYIRSYFLSSVASNALLPFFLSSSFSPHLLDRPPIELVF